MAIEGGYGSAAQFQLMAGAAQAATGQVGRLVQNIAAVQGTVGVVTFAARAFATLEQQLTLTNAVAEGTAKTFKQMQDAVQNASLAMKFSATEGSVALYALASAGLSVQQSISALQGVMVLAQATLTDVGTAADTVAGALSAFQLSAANSTRVANLFSAAIAQSQADMPKLAFALRQVAPVANATGISIEQLVASMDTLFNVGLRGEQTGTALRNIITNLASPTREASEAFIELGVATQKTNGQARDLFEVLADLSKANPSTATLKTMFGADAMAGAQALLNAANEEGYRKRLATDKQFAERAEAIAKRTGKTIVSELQLNLEGISGTNSAFEIAAKQMATLSGSFSTAGNAITLVATQMGQQLAPALRTIANAVTDAGVAFQGLSDHQKGLITQLPLLAAGAYGIYRAFGPLTSIFDRLGGASALIQGITNDPNARATRREVAGAFVASGVNNFQQVRAAGMSGFVGNFYNNGPPTVIQPERLLPPGTTFNGAPVGGTPVTAAQVASGRYGTGYRDASGAAIGRASIPPMPLPVAGPNQVNPAAATFRTNALNLLAKSVASLSLIGIAAVGTWEVGKLIADYLKVDRAPSATMPSVNIGADLARQVQTTALTAPNAYERVETLKKMRESMGPMRDDALAQSALAVKQRNEAESSVKTLYERLRPGATPMMPKLQELLLGEGGKPLDTTNNYTRTNIVQKLNLGRSITDEDLKELQEQVRLWAQGQKDYEQIQENYKDFDRARLVLRDAIAASMKLPTFVTGERDARTAKEKEEAQKLADQAADNLKRTVISQRFIQEYERAARDQMNQVNRVRSSLATDPLEIFTREVISSNYATAKEIYDQAQKAENDIREKFGARIAGKGDIANMLAGADFYETVLNAKGDAYVNKAGQGKQQSIAAMMESGGFTKEQMLARYDEVVAQALSRLEGIDPEAQKILARFTVANRKTFENAITERELREIALMRSARQQAQTNRDYIVAMRERLVAGQQEIYKALAAGASEIDPNIGAQQSIREVFAANQNAVSQLQQFEDAFFQKFNPDGRANDNSPAANEFKKYKDRFMTSLDTLFRVQIGNLIIDAKAARAKALDQLRANASEIKAQQAQIAAELYTFTGDPQFLAQAVTADATAAVAQADRTIAGLRERSRSIVGNIARVQANNGLGMPGVPEVQVPAATASFQTATVSLQTAANQKLDQIIANTAAGRVSLDGYTASPGSRTMPGAGAGSFGIGGIVAGNANISASDLDKVVRTVFGEASNQGDRGMQAVTEVIRNRSSAWGKSPTEIVLSPNQFEPWNGGPARARMEALDPNSDVYKSISKIVSETFSGQRQDITGGALNFYAPKAQAALGRSAPRWDDGTGVDIGDHRFFGGRRGLSLPKANDNVPDPAVIAEATQKQSEMAREIERITQINGVYSNDLNVLIPKLKERGATEGQIAQVQELFGRSTERLVELNKREVASIGETITMLTRLKDAKQAYLNSPGYTAYTQWQLEGQAIDAAGKAMERNGSIADGMQFAMAKARHNISTDFQLASDGLTSFMDKGSGIISGLITGTETDWKRATASMLADIANTIMKALVMRAITASIGGDGGIGSLFGLFGGGSEPLGMIGGLPVQGPVLPSAKGNVFTNGVGGIVGSKQYFPMGDGRTGSISENGAPEGILPLRRGRGGRLGVEVMQPSATPIVPISRSNTTVSNNNQFSASLVIQGGSGGGGSGGESGTPSSGQQRDLQREFESEMQAAFTRFVDKESAPGGRLASGMQRYG